MKCKCFDTNVEQETTLHLNANATLSNALALHDEIAHVVVTESKDFPKTHRKCDIACTHGMGIFTAAV